MKNLLYLTILVLLTACQKEELADPITNTNSAVISLRTKINQCEDFEGPQGSFKIDKTWQLGSKKSYAPIISSAGPSNQMLIANWSDGTETNMMYFLGDVTNGKYEFSFDLIVPQGHGAFISMHKYADSPFKDVGFDIHFKDSGQIRLRAGGETTPGSTFEHDKVMKINMTFDLDKDATTVKVNNYVIGDFDLSNTYKDASGATRIGSINFRSLHSSTHYYIDNVCLSGG